MRRCNWHIPIAAITLFVAVVGLVLSTGKTHAAVLELQVNSLNCTVDQLYTDEEPEYLVQPEACQDSPPATEAITAIQAQNATPSPTTSAQAATRRFTGGSQQDAKSLEHEGQGIFDNTVFEPLARVLGIADIRASSARPVVATTLVAGGAAWVIDAVFFEMRFSQAALAAAFRRKR